MSTIYTTKTIAPLYALFPGGGAPEAHIMIAVRMVEEDRKRFRDEGTCVLGAGVAVWFKAPRKRYESIKILVAAPFQGNVGSHKACERAIAYLRENGIDAFWYDGNMD